jgi:hypothetical protein
MRIRGQGTIEYLVIIAIVVVIALVVVGLLLQIMTQGGGIPETAAKSAWKSTEPWGIIDWSRSANVLTMVLRNNSYETLNLIDVYVTASDANTLASYNVASGGTVTRIVTIASSSCTATSKYALPKANIKIDYNNSYISSKTQYAPADLVGTC